MNEDVFPIENREFPMSFVSFQGCTTKLETLHGVSSPKCLWRIKVDTKLGKSLGENRPYPNLVAPFEFAGVLFM